MIEILLPALRADRPQRLIALLVAKYFTVSAINIRQFLIKTLDFRFLLRYGFAQLRNLFIIGI